MYEKMKSLLCSEKPSEMYMGLQLLDSLADQDLYQRFLSGWSIRENVFHHSDNPFPDWVAWHLWMHAPICMFPITKILRIRDHSLHSLPEKGWERLKDLYQLFLPDKAAIRFYPPKMTEMKALRILGWPFLLQQHPPRSLLLQLQSQLIIHQDWQISYTQKSYNYVLYRSDESWDLEQHYSLVIAKHVDESYVQTSFCICSNPLNHKKYLLYRRDVSQPHHKDTPRNGISISDRAELLAIPDWLYQKPNIDALLGMREEDWEAYFLFPLLPRKTIYTKTHTPVRDDPESKHWTKSRSLDLADTDWLAYGDLAELRFQNNFLISQHCQYPQLEKSTHFSLQRLGTNLLHLLLPLPHLHFTNVWSSRSTMIIGPNYDKMHLASINLFLFWETHFQQQQALIRMELDLQHQEKYRAPIEELLSDALLEQCCYDPLKETTLEKRLALAFRSFCCEIRLLDPIRDDQISNEPGVVLWEMY